MKTITPITLGLVAVSLSLASATAETQGTSSVIAATAKVSGVTETKPPALNPAPNPAPKPAPKRSSIFDTIVYDSGTQVLTLAFNNTYTYRYYGVPPLVYQDLMDAYAQGKFYNQHIRRVYPCRRVYPPSNLQESFTHTKGGTSCPYLLTPRSH